jgi:hypothetical protein
MESAERFFSSLGADVRHGGNRAYYSPVTDHVQMPCREIFNDSVAYYAVLAHEATHWTGAAQRLNRDLSGRFGNEACAAEELIAYNLGNLWRRRLLSKKIENWSLTSLRKRLVKTGGRLVKHARYYWLMLAESHLTRRLFGSMVRRIDALAVTTG